MQNNIQIYESTEFGKLEVIMIGDKPYFPAVECAEVLGYSKPHNAVSRHCAHSLKRGVGTNTANQHGSNSGKQVVEKIFIPEGDLYRLIIRSKLPAAVRFEAWVCDEVLPSIRKHGAYIQEDVLEQMRNSSEFADELIRRLSQEREKNEALLTHINKTAPKVRYTEIVLRCPEAVQASILAKDYGMSAVAFNKLLHKLGIQYRVGRTWLLYAQYQGNGFTITNTYAKNGMVTLVHTCWTQRGRYWLYGLLKSKGILPEVESLGES
ncbi:MAG: phage antirepressor KilAC domain-containing protein [Defluviitaleaceae bacterium]|nr:phage antirepressor KilAC domain-containing protein [Defluviitaleaceae bacterium]